MFYWFLNLRIKIWNWFRIYSLKQQRKIMQDLFLELQIRQGQYPTNSTTYKEIELLQYNIEQVDRLLEEYTSEKKV